METLSGKELWQMAQRHLADALDEVSARPLDDSPMDLKPEVQAHSDTVFRVDRWTRRQGESLCAQLDGQVWPDGFPLEQAAADAHSACFDMDPQYAENPADTVRAKWFRDFLGQTETRAIRAQTVLKKPLAEIAAIQALRGYSSYLGELTEEERERVESDGENIGDEMARHRSTARAAEQAAEEVDDTLDAARTLGMGEECAGGEADRTSILSLFRRLRDDKSLRRIMQLAGRYRRLAQACQRSRPAYGFEETVGVTLGGDVSRLCTSELASLGIEELELDTLRRIAERQAIVYEHRGTEQVSSGPVVVCVDESGSMAGDRIENAKAFALAMAWVARHQGRYCCLLGYSGTGEKNVLELPPGKWDSMQVADWAGHFYYGGDSDLGVPLDELPHRIWPTLQSPLGRTDLILITDGVVGLSDRIREGFLRWKADSQVKSFGIVIQEPGDKLAQVCDVLHEVDAISPRQAAVKDALSI